MTQCNSIVKHQQLRRRAAWTFMVFACGSLMSAKTRKASEHVSVVGNLQNELVQMESRQSVLEDTAAGLKAQVIKLEAEKKDASIRYDSLAASKADIEKLLEARVADAAESQQLRHLTFESELKSMKESLEQTRAHVVDATLRANELETSNFELKEERNTMERQMDFLHDELSSLQIEFDNTLLQLKSLRDALYSTESTLRETQVNLQEANRQNENLRDNEIALRQHVKNLEEYISNLAKRSDFPNEGQDMLDLQNMTAIAYQSIPLSDQEKTTVTLETVYLQTVNFLKSTLNDTRTSLLNTFDTFQVNVLGPFSFDSLLNNRGWPQQLYTAQFQEIWHQKISHLDVDLVSYDKLHKQTIEWLDSLFSTTNEHSWCKSGSLFVKANIDLVAKLLEALMTLLFIDIIVSSVLNWCNNQSDEASVTYDHNNFQRNEDALDSNHR